jgi:hypothetical protein
MRGPLGHLSPRVDVVGDFFTGCGLFVGDADFAGCELFAGCALFGEGAREIRRQRSKCSTIAAETASRRLERRARVISKWTSSLANISGDLAAVGGDLLADHHAATVQQQVVEGVVHAPRRRSS